MLSSHLRCESISNQKSRSDTPLLYKAQPSWFVQVADFTDRLITANKKTRWYLFSLPYYKRQANYEMQGSGQCGREPISKLVSQRPGLEYFT